MSDDRIPIAGPWITDREVDYAADAARNAWYSRAGEYLARFEHAMAGYLGVKHAIAVPHCTAAIHLSLVALDVGPGDEVVVPDATWIASAAPIHYVGATPVFADIDEATWCIDPESFRACITPRTKAVIPVDLYGCMPDMEALLGVATTNNVTVIEDAAEAIGSSYKGKMAGSFGDTGVFSFHGSKTVATGEGGMLVTSNDAINDRVLFLRDHGREPGDRHFLNTEVAFKYRMSPVQAAIGLAQMERIDELISKKREIFSWYAEELSTVEGVTLNPERPGVRSSYWMVTCLVDEAYGLTKDDLMAKFNELGIDTRPFFHPLSSLPAYAATAQAKVARIRNKAAYAISARGVNLPSALTLDRDQVGRVCSALRTILVESRGV
jgi:perosamine synthetase